MIPASKQISQMQAGMADGVELLSLQKLLHHAESVTGASSLFLTSHNSPSFASSSQSSTKIYSSSSSEDDSEFLSNFPPLKPWSCPAMLKGKLNLTFDSAAKSLCFTDHAGDSIPCAALDLDPSAITRLIDVLSWNFLSTPDGHGFLEIIKWKFAEDGPSERATFNIPRSGAREDILLATPLKRKRGHGGKERGDYVTVHGRLYAMSPPFVLPCKAGSSRASRQRNAETDINNPNRPHNHDFEGKTQKCAQTKEVLKGSSKREDKVDDLRRKWSVSKSDMEANYGDKGQLNARGNDEEELVPGFLIELRPCYHGDGPKTHMGGHGHNDQYVELETFEFVYFTGSVSAWQPVLSTLFGKCLQITFLWRKMMLVGEEMEKYSVFVASRRSLLYLTSQERSFPIANSIPCNPSDDNRLRSFKAGNFTGHFKRNVQKDKSTSSSSGFKPLMPCMPESGKHGRTGSYVGVVTDIYMHGSLLRLDRNVWVLLTHQPLVNILGLRVGAIVALTHFHFVDITLAWEKISLLGACFRSHMVVKSFSPVRTSVNAKSHSQSLLTRYIESLSFAAGFWAMLVTVCFRRKFHDIFSQKDILGSNRNEGMVQKFLRLRCSSSPSLQRDILKEFFKHDCSCPMGNLENVIPPLVVPIYSFSQQIEALWADQSSIVWQMRGHAGLNDTVEQFNIKAGNDYFVRRIISSKDLNVILVGILQVSRQTGHLQLVDATGSIDVVIPDYRHFSGMEHCYEVKDYAVVLEGILDPFKLKRKGRLPLSCKSLMDRNTTISRPYSLVCYVHFYISNAIEFRILTSPNICINNVLENEQARKNQFGVLLVTHKYPSHVKRDAMTHCFFAEAVILPYFICTGSEIQSTHIQIFQDENSVNLEVGSATEAVLCICGSFHRRSLNENMVLHAKLHILTMSALKENLINVQPEKVLIEFSPECMSLYQTLCIGNCYLIQHNFKEGYTEMDASHSLIMRNKVKVTPEVSIWNLSFRCGHQLKASADTQRLNSFKHASNDQCSLSFYVSDNIECCTSNNIDNRLYFNGLSGFSTNAIYDDAVLYLPCHTLCQIKEFIKNVEKREINVALKIHDATSNSFPQLLNDFDGGNSANFECNLPKGELISFHGEIEYLSGEELSRYDNDNHCGNPSIPESTTSYFLEKAVYSVLIQGSHGPYRVRLLRSCNKFILPAGFGPGVSASFHRFLLQSGPGSRKDVLEIPSSFIVIKCTKEVQFSLKNKAEGLHQSYLPLDSQEQVSTLISCLAEKSAKDNIKLRCKVIAVPSVVFKWEPGEYLPSSVFPSGVLKSVQLIHGIFILDDGSGLCCCHASGERAAYLLGLHTFGGESIDEIVTARKTSNCGHSKITICTFLRHFVKKYKQIDIQWSYDFSLPKTQAFILKSSKDLDNEDYKFVSLFFSKACSSPPLVISGHICSPSSDCGDSRSEQILIDNADFSPLTQCTHVWAIHASPVDYMQEIESMCASLSLMF